MPPTELGKSDHGDIVLRLWRVHSRSGVIQTCPSHASLAHVRVGFKADHSDEPMDNHEGISLSCLVRTCRGRDRLKRSKSVQRLLVQIGEALCAGRRGGVMKLATMACSRVIPGMLPR